MSSVPFLRAPYTFVSRTDDDLGGLTLDDPRLADLVIATYPRGVPGIALRNRGLEANLREYAPVSFPGGFDRDTPILDAVAAGDVDVAIVYGPAAAARGEQAPGLLRIEPVTPETELGATIVQMFRIWTIGVRPHDVVFRERLNAAMAARWEDIEAAIDAYGVHRLDIRRPPVTPPAEPAALRIGVVVPSATREYHLFETVGEAARRGAELAQNAIARSASEAETAFEVLTASAPSDAAAVRAAERLTVTEGVFALVGGFGRAQAEDLSRIAAERGLVFFNIAARDDALRGRLCTPSTFHVEASTSMYADAAVAWYAGTGLTGWYLVVERSDSSDELVEHLRETVTRHGGSLVGVSLVEPNQFMYLEEIRAIDEVSPDIVLAVLDAHDLDVFYAQVGGHRLDVVVTAVPDARAQTREFLYRFRQGAPQLAASPRPALWETSIEDGEAGDINERFTSRTGEPMEATAWAAYVAVMVAHQAAQEGVADDRAALITYLSDPATTFDAGLGKGGGLSFRPWDHQLRQPLFMVGIDVDAHWGNRLSPRVGFARSVGTVPQGGDDGVREALDRLGVGSPSASRCRF
jgi:ABC transporter substrate binding protein (PQQ-dependent alcohol dehydrogenase system)